jgi:hypothetical protein
MHHYWPYATAKMEIHGRICKIQSNLVIPDLVIPDYIHFFPYTGELSKTEQG